MAVSTVDATMRKKFYDEFKVDFEREKSTLKQTVRSDGLPKAKTLQFDVIDTSDEATSRQRDGKIPISQMDQSVVTTDLLEHFKKFTIDDFDAFRANPNVRAMQIRKAIGSTNRAVDAQIVASLDATSNVVNSGTAIDFGAYGKILDWTTQLWNNDVQNEGNIWGVVTPNAWAQMMTIDQFINADYVDAKSVENGIKTAGYKRWLGVNWLTHTGLTGRGTSAAKCYLYDMDAIGHADDGEPETMVGYDDTEDQHFCWARVRHAAVAILTRGIYRAVHDDTATIG